MTANVDGGSGLRSARTKRIAAVVAALVVGGALAGLAFSAGGAAIRGDSSGKALWRSVSAQLPATHDGATADVQTKKLGAFKLDKTGIDALLKSAPAANAGRPRAC